MKVVAFNGSPRKKGNTEIALNTVLGELSNEGIDTELIQIGGKNLKGCNACGKCKENKDGFCIIKNDDLNDYLKKIYEADGLIIGSPVYFGSITPDTKAFIDRVGYCSRAADFALKRKVCASVVVQRRGGDVDAFNQINNLFLLSQCIIPCSIYWNMAIGRNKGEILEDAEGIKTFETLGRNMAWLLKKISD